MAGDTAQVEKLKQLLELQAMDLEIREAERDLGKTRDELSAVDDGVLSLQDGLAKLDARLKELRLDARSGERAVDEKRDALARIKGRVSNVQNEKQYSAATLEFDLVRRDLRALEDQVLEKLQVIEDLDRQRKELADALEAATADAGPQREEMQTRAKELEEALAVKKDRRENLAIRVDGRSMALYDRIISGRSDVALAPITDEGVCGNCHTFVTVQQTMEVNQLDRLICCEGCGVILYPQDFK